MTLRATRRQLVPRSISLKSALSAPRASVADQLCVAGRMGPRAARAMTARRKAYALLAIVFAAASPADARADLSLFGKFDPAKANQKSSFINGKSVGFLSRNLDITFQYTVDNGYGDKNSNIKAMETITAFADGKAVQTVIKGTTYDYQPLKEVQIKITAKTPVDGKSILLATDKMTTGVLGGEDGARVALLFGNTEDKSLVDKDKNIVVNFSSDFLDFSGTKQRSYSITLRDLTAPLGINGNGYLNSFDAPTKTVEEGNPMALFKADAAPVKTPEPASWMFPVVACGLMLARRRVLRSA
jgi:hypothetical protein